MDIKAEVFFLIVKLLEDEGCVTAAESLKRFIDEKKLLPARINTVGVPFDNTFENYDSLHNLSRPSVLVEYYQRLVKLVHDNNRCASHLKTLIGIQNKVEKAFSTRCIDFHISKDHKKTRKSLLSHLHQRSKLQFHILAHRTAIYCLEFDKRGNYVFTGSDDYTIKVWSVKGSSTPSCTLRHTLRGHVAEIIELTISIDNHLLASIDSNCCLVIWCLKTGQPVVAVRGSRNNRVLSGLGFLNLPETTWSMNKVTSNSNDIHHPSGMLIVSSFGGYLHIIPYIHTIHNTQCRNHEFNNMANSTENRWICCSVQLLPTIRFTTAPEGTPNVFWPSITCIDISPGGLLVAAGCSDQRIRLYQFMNPLKPQLASVLAAHEESVNSVAFSHCGLKLATGSSDGGSCWLWKYQAGQWRSMTLTFRKRVKCRPCLLVWSIHDQYLIASMKNGSVYVYFGHSGQLVTIIEGHEGAIHAVSPSPFDENILATGGVDGRFQLWNISNLRRFQQQQQHSDEDSHLLIDKPLLFHYRFPPGDLDIIQGLVWRFDNPPDDQPIWSGVNTTTTLHRRTTTTTRDGQQFGVLDPSYHAPIDSQTENTTFITNNSINNHSNHTSSHHRSLTGSRSLLNTTNTTATATNTTTRTGSMSNTKVQRITACRVLPTIEGVGFLVVTKSGVMSLFSPTEEEPTDSSCKYNTVQTPLVDEQFLHWELDTAEWREVLPDPHNTTNTNTNNNNNNLNPNLLRIYENTLQALGNPPAQQSASSLSNNGRIDVSRDHSQNNHHRRSINHNHNNNNTNDNSNNDTNQSNQILRYTPPPSVLYEIIHAPSGVPFHRLPPGYLTNLRGFPYPSIRQLQIPGRGHLMVQPLDLLPSVTLDEETGEDIVVDDIQFCSNVPLDYCPTPELSNTQPIYGKNYFWCSPWLTNNKTSLIEPLDMDELK
ncbi:unnamed protein product [Schistosoma turkestanicum]|nr:unnamed protein product [Schistosoma turkestanicum]